MLVFGGYDGSNRCNDLYEFQLGQPAGGWRTIVGEGAVPSPRDRHVGVVNEGCFYVFGGFDGNSRVNDFYEFNMESRMWRLIAPIVAAPNNQIGNQLGNIALNGNGVEATTTTNNNGNALNNNNATAPAAPALPGADHAFPPLHAAGTPPSPRHSHAAVVHANSLYVFGGYDGSYRSDFHQYSFGESRWSAVLSAGRVPRARYRSTCTVNNGCMYVFGGHDGTRHLNDVHVYDFGQQVWSTLITNGAPPIPRDSHVAVVNRESMYVFGGSTGQAMSDFHELNLTTCKWTLMKGEGEKSSATSHSQPGALPGHRFCHVAVVEKDTMLVFGGYDGTHRLNDFLAYRFGSDLSSCEVPQSTIISDLKSFVNNESLADISFEVEEQVVHAHKIMLMRCSYFKAMLEGGFRESTGGASKTPIRINDVRHQIFIALLEYLYTDRVDVQLDEAMELFQAADQFGVERLKIICEHKMLASITVDNAASIFHAADLHTAKGLREKALNFILNNFEAVSKTKCFEEMARSNVELVLQILQKR